MVDYQFAPAALQEVEIVPTSVILEKCKRSSDFIPLEDEGHWLEELVREYDPETPSIDRLIKSLLDRGFLPQGAINIMKNNICRGTCCAHLTQISGWYLQNGHHRLAAAIHLGIDEIPVVFDKVTYPDTIWEGKNDWVTDYLGVRRWVDDNDQGGV